MGDPPEVPRWPLDLSTLAVGLAALAFVLAAVRAGLAWRAGG